MPPDEPNESLACERHPGSEVVATCEGCGRALCLRCAVPVRGTAYGDECLTEILGPNLAATPVPASRWRRPTQISIGVGFAITTFASILPWQRFGQGAGILGAWGLSPRYSVFCALLAIAGSLIWASVAPMRGRRPGRWWLPTLRATSVLVIATAILHIARPPSIGPSWVGPWVAIAGGVVAFVGTLARSAGTVRSSTT